MGSLVSLKEGLINAVKEVFPDVHHRFCVWHLWKNFNKQWKDLQLRGLLWDCARCTSQDGFLDIIKKIERVNKEAWEYLNKWPYARCNTGNCYKTCKFHEFRQPRNGLPRLESVPDHRSTGLDPQAHHSGKRASLFLFILLMMLPNDRGLFEFPAALLVLAITFGLQRGRTEEHSTDEETAE
ncbi:uncharacterized protein LOC110263740 [Arachis ipaensis]|uniref:uncharacterized protein LOC110263740 n=1 Tax=Arachis ipaensis TaxID=130454 RepID=UPI000A2B7984|nr:uncharacterized protein LOC110263740 [Arachis ipaensis]